MTGRPICIIMLALVGILSIIRIQKSDLGEIKEALKISQKELAGEEKEFVCQVESVMGQGEDKTIIVRDVMEGQTKFCERMKLQIANKKNSYGRNTIRSEDYISTVSELKIGNIIRVKGKVEVFSLPGNPGQFDEYHYNRDAGIDCRFAVESVFMMDSSYRWVQQRLNELRNAFFLQIVTCLPEKEAGIISAMILGEKSLLSSESKELYQEAGISHILAISGLHISLIGAGLFYFLRRYVMPMKAAAILTGVLLLAYGELVGFPIATERAVIMMLCVLGARFVGRQYDVFCALALSAMIQLAVHPMELFSSGFLLSYGAVLGIALWVKPFQETEGICQGIAGAIGMQFVTLPIILYFYYEWNPYSILVNVIVLPFISILVGMSVFAGTTAFIGIFAGKFFFGIVHVVLRGIEIVCLLAGKLPGARWIVGRPNVWQLAVYYGILLLWLFLKEKGNEFWGKYRKVLLFLGIFVLFFRGHSDNLIITNLDIGQGDCTCIRLEDKTILIDGGSSDVSKVGKYRISQYLKYYGIQRIDYIFFTHSDSDHTNGLQEIIEENNHMGFDIGTVVLPGIEKQDEAYLDLIRVCDKNCVPVRYMTAGAKLQIENLNLQCLHPSGTYDWKNENDYSFVFLLSYGNFKGLFTGDLEQTGEEEVLSAISDVNYLKVAHHGSKGASSEKFLAIAKPEVAVVSAGEGNRYGHPSSETLERLDQIGAKTYCTIDCGAVMTETDGRKWWVRTWYGE